MSTKTELARECNARMHARPHRCECPLFIEWDMRIDEKVQLKLNEINPENKRDNFASLKTSSTRDKSSANITWMQPEWS